MPSSVSLSSGSDQPFLIDGDAAAQDPLVEAQRQVVQDRLALLEKKRQDRQRRVATDELMQQLKANNKGESDEAAAAQDRSGGGDDTQAKAASKRPSFSKKKIVKVSKPKTGSGTSALGEPLTSIVEEGPDAATFAQPGGAGTASSSSLLLQDQTSLAAPGVSASESSLLVESYEPQTSLQATGLSAFGSSLFLDTRSSQPSTSSSQKLVTIAESELGPSLVGHVMDRSMEASLHEMEMTIGALANFQRLDVPTMQEVRYGNFDAFAKLPPGPVQGTGPASSSTSRPPPTVSMPASTSKSVPTAMSMSKKATDAGATTLRSGACCRGCGSLLSFSCGRCGSGCSRCKVLQQQVEALSQAFVGCVGNILRCAELYPDAAREELAEVLYLYVNPVSHLQPPLTHLRHCLESVRKRWRTAPESEDYPLDTYYQGDKEYNDDEEYRGVEEYAEGGEEEEAEVHDNAAYHDEQAEKASWEQYLQASEEARQQRERSRAEADRDPPKQRLPSAVEATSKRLSTTWHWWDSDPLSSPRLLAQREALEREDAQQQRLGVRGDSERSTRSPMQDPGAGLSRKNRTSAIWQWWVSEEQEYHRTPPKFEAARNRTTADAVQQLIPSLREFPENFGNFGTYLGKPSYIVREDRPLRELLEEAIRGDDDLPQEDLPPSLREAVFPSGAAGSAYPSAGDEVAEKEKEKEKERRRRKKKLERKSRKSDPAQLEHQQHEERQIDDEDTLQEEHRQAKAPPDSWLFKA